MEGAATASEVRFCKIAAVKPACRTLGPNGDPGDRSSEDWLLTGAIEKDEKMAMDLAGPGYHINRSNLLVLESKADMQKRGQASPDDGDALALTFAQAVAPAEKEESATKTTSSAGTAGSTARARGCDEPHSKRRTKTRHRADLAARRQRLHGDITGGVAG